MALSEWISPFTLRNRGILGMNRRNVAYITRYNDRSRYPLVDDKLKTKLVAAKAGVTVPELLHVIRTQHEIETIDERLHRVVRARGRRRRSLLGDRRSRKGGGNGGRRKQSSFRTHAVILPARECIKMDGRTIVSRGAARGDSCRAETCRLSRPSGGTTVSCCREGIARRLSTGA